MAWSIAARRWSLPVVSAAAVAVESCRQRRGESWPNRVLWPSVAHPHFSGARCDDGKSGNQNQEQESQVNDMFVESQRHLLKATTQNPTPTMVPPPIAGLSGHHMRHRMVTCVIGRPLLGQAHIARRLQRYLTFFHGAHTDLFSVNNYPGSRGRDQLLEELRSFFEAEGDAHEKHAIIYSTNALSTYDSPWSAHSKMNRRWLEKVLRHELNAHLYIIDIQVAETQEHLENFVHTHPLTQEMEGSDKLAKQIEEYAKRIVMIQDDGTEDDLHYLQLIDYNRKVITCNMISSFLGSHVARFLSNIHPYKHTVYFVRCGQSEYAAAGKIGGDSPLSAKGDQYAQRLAEFTDFAVCQGRQVAIVTIDAKDVGSLRNRLVQVDEDETVQASGQDDQEEVITQSRLVAFGDWTHASGHGELQDVHEGMTLERILTDDGEGFKNAPKTMEEFSNQVNAGKAVTLVFADKGEEGEVKKAHLWTSQLTRATQTVMHVRHPRIKGDLGEDWVQLEHQEYRNLGEQYAGEYEGLTYAELAQREPMEAQLREKDKLGYRYPRGESYLDVCTRLEDSVQLLESHRDPVVIVAHLPVLRLLYAYITGIPREQAPSLDFDGHAVIRVDFDGTDNLTEKRIFLGPPCGPDDNTM